MTRELSEKEISQAWFDGDVHTLRAEIERLNRYAERLRANAERDANEIERLTADKIKLAEETLQLRQIVDGYMRAAKP